jgi:hypothetical protein
MALLPGQKITFPPCPWLLHKQRKDAEFHDKVGHILVPFVWGPDRFGYEQKTEFIKLPNGTLHERNIMVRITDLSQYPQEWKDYKGYKPEWGPFWITAKTIIEEDEGSPVNPIEVSDDEEEYVPGPLDMSDDE